MLTLFVALFIVGGLSQPFHGSTWQQKQAYEKQQLLWNAITSNESPGPWPSALQLAEIFLESMNPTFDAIQDDLPTQGGFGFNRVKLIHSVGCTGLGSFVSNGNSPYTGLFTNASNVILRFSTAKAYDATPYSFTPAIGFKFLRSGVKSGNFMTMFSLEGQSSYNFFKHDLSNHVTDLSLNASSALRALKFKFESVSDYPSLLGLSDIASFDQNGHAVAHPRFPFRLVFQPAKALKTMFSDQFASSDLCDTVGKVPTGTIYYVYAEDTPGDEPQLIGFVDLTQQPVRSNFGDVSLFFEHQRMEDDFKIHPEWVQPAKAILSDQTNSYYYNGYPDLPDL